MSSSNQSIEKIGNVQQYFFIITTVIFVNQFQIVSCKNHPNKFYNTWNEQNYIISGRNDFPGIKLNGEIRYCGKRDILEAIDSIKKNNITYLGHHMSRSEIYLPFLHSVDNVCKASLGYEIGALHNPSKIPIECKSILKYIDQISVSELIQKYPELDAKHLTSPDIIDNANILQKIPDGGADFIIASHVIEHMPLPIIAVKNWLRILKTNGIAFITAPYKCNSFDHYRLVTSWKHFLSENDAVDTERDLLYIEHLREWTLSHLYSINNTNIPTQEEYGKYEQMFLKGGQEQSFKDRGGMHFHTWTHSSYVEFFLHLLTANNALKMPVFNIEGFGFNGNDMFTILRRI